MNAFAVVTDNRVAASWEIEVQSIEFYDELYTEETVINYDGSTQVLKHHNTPSNGKIYVVATIDVEKQDVLVDPFDASGLQLKTLDSEYARMQDDSFLMYHNYTVFSTAQAINISSRGSICFEVPANLKNESALGWTITNGVISSAAYQGEITEVPLVPNIVEEQSEIEEYLLAVYEQNGKADIENPFLELNPYGTAPLSALVMFETATACDVTVTVKGKNGAPDFTYTLSQASTHHEVPIIGLYANYNNTVILSAENEKNTIQIVTDELPSDMEKPLMQVSNNNTVLENGFIFVAGNYRLLIDSDAEIRWYSTIVTGSDPSGIDLVSASDGVWFSVNPYSAGAMMYNQSWLGKINYNISWISSAHHDITKVSDSEYLYWGANQLLKLDVNTREISVYFDPASVLDSSIDSLEMRQEREGDWLHPNTVSYADGYLYLSFRNQHMVLKMNYQTKEIMWVATPASGRSETGDIYAIQKDVVDKIVLPADGDSDFEWFYSQHEIVPLPDIDNNPNTDDFTVFDNGQERGVYGLYEGLTNKNDFYSRIVHYRVDNTSKTIKQIFEYGKEASPSLSSYYYGGAQYIADDLYLGCFGMLDFANDSQYGESLGSKIVAVYNNGTQACMWYFQNGYTYRAHYLSMSDFDSIASPKLGESGEAIYENTVSWQKWTASDHNYSVKYDLNGISIQKDGKMSLSGWAYLPSAKDQYKNVFLVAQNADESYKIKLFDYAGMIPEGEEVPEGYRQGFVDRTIDTTQLPDGMYELGLQVEAGGQVGYVALPYTITVGEPTADLGSGEWRLFPTKAVHFGRSLWHLSAHSNCGIQDGTASYHHGFCRKQRWCGSGR